MFGLILLTSLLAIGFSSKILNLDGRIYNGYDTTIEEFPYMVALLSNGNFICGATIVAPKIIITAAHCIDGMKSNDLQIKCGVTNYHDNDNGFVYNIAKIIPHSYWEWTSFQNDIAILMTNESIQFNDEIQPAKLPDSNDIIFDNSVAFAAGWGLTENDLPSDTLKAVELHIYDRQHCLKLFGPNRFTNKNICAGNHLTNGDACNGDSGGPLIANGKLIGIISWGYGCGLVGYAGMYTNVSAFSEWIDSVVNTNY